MTGPTPPLPVGKIGLFTVSRRSRFKTQTMTYECSCEVLSASIFSDDRCSQICSSRLIDTVVDDHMFESDALYMMDEVWWEKTVIGKLWKGESHER